MFAKSSSVLRTITSPLLAISLVAQRSSSTMASGNDLQRAQFGLGCFWGSEAAFGVLPGVERVCVGYTGGKKDNPTYRALDDHTEAVQVDFDPQQISYKKLLNEFWKEHDPTMKHKAQYKSAIFYQNDEQKREATEAKAEIEKKLGKSVVTDILPASKFFNAENYHQKYFLRNSPLYNRLGLNDEQLITSNAASRLNGHLRGYGNAEQFEKEWQTWKISDKDAAYIREVMAQGPQGEC